MLCRVTQQACLPEQAAWSNDASVDPLHSTVDRFLRYRLLRIVHERVRQEQISVGLSGKRPGLFGPAVSFT
jgi:hypothetical protein